MRKLDELVGKILSLGKSRYYKFKLYMSASGKPYGSEVNENIDAVPALLEELKRDYGFPYEIVDTDRMSLDEIRAVYALCAHWAMTSFNGRRIYKLFRKRDKLGSSAGEKLGREIPVLIVYFLNLIFCVLPHQVVVEERIEETGMRRRSEEVITIYEFLTALKERLSRMQNDA